MVKLISLMWDKKTLVKLFLTTEGVHFFSSVMKRRDVMLLTSTGVAYILYIIALKRSIKSKR